MKEKIERENFTGKAKVASPCIIFIDEIDSIASSRTLSNDSSGVTNRVLSQLLSELDGLQDSGGLVFIAATNAPHILDLALMRPGRLDRFCHVPAPNEEDKKKIYVTAYVKEALWQNFIFSTDDGSFKNGQTGVKYGANINSIISYLMNPANQSELDNIKERVEEKWNSK